MQMQSADAGAVLRFLDIYEHMEGGTIKLALSGPVGRAADRPGRRLEFRGWSTSRGCVRSCRRAPPGDGRSLNEAVKRDIDTSRVSFERGFAADRQGRRHAEARRTACCAGR